MPVQVNFTGQNAVVIGDDFSHTFVFEDSQCAPLSQTGSVFYAQARKAGILLITFTCYLDPVESHKVHVTIPASETASLEPIKDALWDLKRDSGVIKTLFGGKLDIEGSVTVIPGS